MLLARRLGQAGTQLIEGQTMEPSGGPEARKQMKREIAIRLGAGFFVLCLLAYYGNHVYQGAGEEAFSRFLTFAIPIVLLALAIYLVQVWLLVRKYRRS
ncbi:hypothetical protein [Microvirga sp. TS319]|uniref:hypothetical protein n=1 Tax=Microvirga sp. TS319 TaxID=3241165 RepID=UPI003519DA36